MVFAPHAGATVFASEYGLTAGPAGHGFFRRGLVLLGALPFIGMLAGRFQGVYLIATDGFLLTGSMFLFDPAHRFALISFNSPTLLRIAQYAPLGWSSSPPPRRRLLHAEGHEPLRRRLVNFMRNSAQRRNFV